jgi:hypothetical protein
MGLCAACLCDAGWAEPQETYLHAVRQELIRLQLVPECDDGRGVCGVRMALPDSPEQQLEVVVRVSPATATVHMSIDELVRVEGTRALTLELARALLEWGAQLVTAKLEWNAQQASVRLSTFVGTDSNFDRAAFRAQILALAQAASALRPRILALISPAADSAGKVQP